MAKKTDLRRLTHQELTQFRRQAVAQVQSGVPVMDVVRSMGVSRTALFHWLALYRAGGWDALDAGKRGGRRPKLDAKAIEWLYRTLTRDPPTQWKFPFALWTLKLVVQLIHRELGIRLSRWSVARLLRQLGLSPQRPLWRAWQQDAGEVARWKAEVYPEIRRRARQRQGVIYFLDESAVRSDHHAGTTWAPKGKTPEVRATGARFALNVIGAISPQGEFRFMLFEKTLNAQRFIEFLKRLLHDEQRPIFLIVDGHPVHRSRAVRQFVESTRGHLELYFLPPYSPEINPVEQVWNYAKNHRIGKQVITGPGQLKRLVLSALRSIQRLSAVVRGFFHHPECRYILAGT